ncbi:palmitoyltransferase ZDHHC3/7/25 [Marchantia polymorpha subsp. ruderalis]|uniref:S-acyltransferase n=2 Tax=Marchantia polymorpha TaxID=3197 RepID=A0AAF6BZR4_MARPO|nr:hypothetical protein MARPO_0009s0186 [Marchantia polymorpha]BBN17498.1 hypothetical protein Mp_7g15020 [Marchantia polymorpha subsp. ruderalis]|eukprot:PTQ47104.1 hypothetical protein MARPO_0009s0186 [Marchantia polymorpha]
MGFRRFLSLPVAVVLVLIGFVYHTVVFLVIEPWLSLSTAPGLFNALFFTGLGVMAVLCYVIAVLKDPGRIPLSYMPDLEDSGVALHEVKRKGGDLRYCQKCAHYKPPRAHHCRVCKRCVLRMDHHCVWINNCVGHNNYKAFFLFVLYVVAACIHALILLGGQAIQELGADSEMQNTDALPKGMPVSSSLAFSAIVKVVCAVVLVPLLVAVTVLLAWHVYLLLHNKTTIEYHEGVRARWLAEKAGHHYRHPYDLGVVSNIVTLLGPSATFWFIPTATGHVGSGLQFRTFYDQADPRSSR